MMNAFTNKQQKITSAYLILGWGYDLTKLISAVFILGFFTYTYLFSFAQISGESMSPTYTNDTPIIISKAQLYFNTVQRLDVVTFYFPGAPDDRYVKRVIGLPGETVSIHNNQVTINGTILTEPYLAGSVTMKDSPAVTLHNDEYFVMGDNRAESLDSRTWGGLPKAYMIGKVTAVPGSSFITRSMNKLKRTSNPIQVGNK